MQQQKHRVTGESYELTTYNYPLWIIDNLAAENMDAGTNKKNNQLNEHTR